MAKVSSHAAKTSFQWRLLVRAIQDLPLEEMATQITKDFALKRWSNSSGWLIMLLGAVGLLYWNSRLVLALGAGIVVMLMVYLWHDWQPAINLAEVRKLLRGWNQPFVLSVGAGAIATLTTYTAFSIWAESESAWIAAGAILQGAGTLAVLLLLVAQAIHRQTTRDRVHYQHLLTDLTHDDPLRRLIAVRQLTDSISVLEDTTRDRRGKDKQPTRREIADYFRVMLSREPDPIVRDAVWDGLQTLDIVHQLKQATEPVVTFSNRQRIPVKQHRVKVKSTQASR